MNTTYLGNIGEKAVCDYLENAGYKILRTNFKAAGGEVDIIAKKEGHLAFVEVKTRKDTSFGYGTDAVNYHKQQRIIRAARAFIMTYEDYDEISFDVCEVYTKKRIINYIVSAFEA